MPTMPVWILEDDPRRAEQMLRLCARWNVAVCVFRTANALNNQLDRCDALPGVLSLDHDLNHTVPARSSECGMDVVDRLVTLDPFASIIVHSSNTDSAAAMVTRLSEAGWSVSQVVPSDDLFWLDAEWIGLLEQHLRAAVSVGDSGLLLTRSDAVSGLLSANEADCLERRV